MFSLILFLTLSYADPKPVPPTKLELTTRLTELNSRIETLSKKIQTAKTDKQEVLKGQLERMEINAKKLDLRIKFMEANDKLNKNTLAPVADAPSPDNPATFAPVPTATPVVPMVKPAPVIIPKASSLKPIPAGQTVQPKAKPTQMYYYPQQPSRRWWWR